MGWVLFGLMLGSVIFFFVAGGLFDQLRKMPNLSRVERSAYRTAERHQRLPVEADVQSAVIEFARWDASPGVLESTELWVMGGWIVISALLAAERLFAGDARSAGRAAAITVVPAIAILTVSIRRFARSRGQRILALDAATAGSDHQHTERRPVTLLSRSMLARWILGLLFLVPILWLIFGAAAAISAVIGWTFAVGFILPRPN